MHGIVLRLAHTSVSQLLDEFRLRTRLRFRNEIECAVTQLLGNALRTEPWHLVSHALLVRSKEKTLSLVIESHTAQLHMITTVILLPQIATIILLVAVFRIIFVHI